MVLMRSVDTCVGSVHNFGIVDKVKGRPYVNFTAYYDPSDATIHSNGTPIAKRVFDVCVSEKVEEAKEQMRQKQLEQGGK